MERTETQEPVELIRCALNLVDSPWRVHPIAFDLQKKGRAASSLHQCCSQKQKGRGRGPEGGREKALRTHGHNQPHI